MVSTAGNQQSKPLPPGLAGTWELVRLVGRAPLLGLMKATGSVIVLAADGSCEARLRIKLGGFLPVPALPRQLRGNYLCPTKDSVRFEGTWNGHKESLTYQFSLSKDTLNLKSTMGYTLVLHRTSPRNA